MDRKFMFIEKNLTTGGCLPLPWGYVVTASGYFRLCCLDLSFYMSVRASDS